MAERRVWIAQCLCPARHAIAANAGEADDQAAAEREIMAPLRTVIADWLERGEANPWCGLCHAGVETWSYEVGRTRFATMAEARPALMENARQQAVARALFGDDLKRSD